MNWNVKGVPFSATSVILGSWHISKLSLNHLKEFVHKQVHVEYFLPIPVVTVCLKGLKADGKRDASRVRLTCQVTDRL